MNHVPPRGFLNESCAHLVVSYMHDPVLKALIRHFKT